MHSNGATVRRQRCTCDANHCCFAPSKRSIGFFGAIMVPFDATPVCKQKPGTNHIRCYLSG